MPTVCRAVVSPRLKDLLRACFKKKWRTPLAGSHISCVKICLYCNRAAPKDNFHLKDRCFVQAAPYCSTPSTHTIATMAIFHATVPPRTVAHVRSRAGHHKSWPHLRCEDGVVTGTVCHLDGVFMITIYGNGMGQHEWRVGQKIAHKQEIQ